MSTTSMHDAAELPGPPLQGIRLLVVDDSEDSRCLASHFLAQAFGTQVLTAEHGLAALEVLAREPVDLIFLDLGMPVMDGYQAAQAIRADPRTRDLPILALTAHTGAAELDRARAAGCDGWVCKPFSRQDLVRAVEAQLAARPRAPAGVDRLRRGFLESRMTDARGLTELAEAGNWYQLRRIAQQLQSGARAYDLPELGGTAAQLTDAVERRDGGPIAALQGELLERLDGLLVHA